VMHLAAALRRPIISIWGNTVPEFGMYPYFGQPGVGYPLSVILQVEGLPCRPCSKLGYDHCPKGHFRCMRDLSESAVNQAVSSFWNSR
jgi:ADP-heptose:LPS heptosyltransferase